MTSRRWRSSRKIQVSKLCKEQFKISHPINPDSEFRLLIVNFLCSKINFNERLRSWEKHKTKMDYWVIIGGLKLFVFNLFQWRAIEFSSVKHNPEFCNFEIFKISFFEISEWPEFGILGESFISLIQKSRTIRDWTR